MKSEIEELILENCSFMQNIKTTDSYIDLCDDNDKIYKRLKATLNKEQLELLDKLVLNAMGMEAEATESYLLHGFKTGIRLIIECL